MTVPPLRPRREAPPTARHPRPSLRRRRSASATSGPDRRPDRAPPGRSQGVGFTDDDLAGRSSRGHQLDRDDALQLNQRRLASSSRRASGPPGHAHGVRHDRDFDGVAMGSEGMKASLVSRDLIADSIELAAGAPLRRARLPGRLRQDDPARPWPWPGSTSRLVLYNGTIYRAPTKGSATPRSSPSRGHALPSGTSPSTSCTMIESVPVRGGACGGQFTANTMSTVMEFHRPLPGRPQRDPREDPAKDAAPALRRDRHGPRPGDRRRRVRHQAGARERDRRRGRHRRLDKRRPPPPRDRPRARHPARARRLRRIADRTPLVADMMPVVATPPPTCTTRRRRPGHARAAQARPPPRRRATVDGRTIAEIAAAVVETPASRSSDRSRPRFKPTAA